MDTNDRKRITTYITDLIRFTRYRELMDLCLQEKLLFPVMEEEIEKCIENEIKHKLLFVKITKRGPKAYNTLLKICRQNFVDAAAILERRDAILEPSSMGYSEVSLRSERAKQAQTIKEHKTNEATASNVQEHVYPNVSINNAINPRTESLTFEPYTLDVQSKLNLTVKKSTAFHKHNKLKTYNMQSKNRGIFFLINIINFKTNLQRNGAEMDRDNLISLFRQMGFQIFYYEDISVQELKQLIVQLKNSKYIQNTDCLIFTLLTHGAYVNGELLAEFSDSSDINIEDILHSFNNENCISLARKPKIFILPFCRGKRRDRGVLARRVQTDSMPYGVNSDYFVNMPTLNDVKICYATVPGFETFRDPDEHGSWYVEVMCKIWAEHAHDTHLDDLLSMVGSEIANRRTADTNELQTTSNEDRGFFNALYFNPGYYGDDDDLH